jgi:hypothetical protein
MSMDRPSVTPSLAAGLARHEQDALATRMRGSTAAMYERVVAAVGKAAHREAGGIDFLTFDNAVQCARDLRDFHSREAGPQLAQLRVQVRANLGGNLRFRITVSERLHDEQRPR